MLKKKIKKIAIVFVFSVLILTGLYVRTSLQTNGDGGFNRMFIPHALGKTKTIDLGLNSFYISGLDSQHIYLSNWTASTYLLISGPTLSQIDTFHIQLADSLKKFFFACSVSNRTLFFDDPNHNIILYSTFPFQHIQNYHFTTIPYFNALLPVSSGSVVLRTFKKTRKQNILTKLSGVRPFILEMPQILKQGDEGYFSTDGTLCLDQSSNQLSYVYRYRNSFIVMDTNLNLIHQSQTIDTTDHPHLNISSYADKDKVSTTFSSPPFEVNRNACASAGLLYVCSNIRAKNEKQSVFDLFSVLDVYREKDGRYQFSFYVPKQHNRPVSSFRVDKKTLYAICDQYISLYELSF